MSVNRADIFQAVSLPTEISAPTTHFDAIATKTIESGGVMAARILENDKRTVFCRGAYAVLGDIMVAPWKAHVLLWVSGENESVMYATDDLEQIQPLKTLKIRHCEIPECLMAIDVFSKPDETALVYVGQTEPGKIREKTRVRNINFVQAGSPDDWRFNSRTVGFKKEGSDLSIFPQSGDIHLSCHFKNESPGTTTTSPFYRRYAGYVKDGGVIGISFMRDASTLSGEEMRKKYPRDHFYVEDPEEQIVLMQRRIGIELTEGQKRLYYNLRWIPTDFPQVIYNVGPTPPNKRLLQAETVFRHPSDLGEEGLLGQVFRLTKDETREAQLGKYCRTHG